MDVLQQLKKKGKIFNEKNSDKTAKRLKVSSSLSFQCVKFQVEKRR